MDRIEYTIDGSQVWCEGGRRCQLRGGSRGWGRCAGEVGQRQLRYSSQALGVHACGSGHLLRQQKTLARAAAPNILSTGLTAEVSLRCAACAAHFRDVAQTCCMCMATLMYHQYCGVVCRPFSVFCSQSTRPSASSASSPPLVNKPPPPPGLSQRHPSRVLSIGLILRLLLRIMSILLLLLLLLLRRRPMNGHSNGS